MWYVCVCTDRRKSNGRVPIRQGRTGSGVSQSWRCRYDDKQALRKRAIASSSLGNSTGSRQERIWVSQAFFFLVLQLSH